MSNTVSQELEKGSDNIGAKKRFESLREVIGLISAGAGIFAALLYLAGRSFASGYFEAMNIQGYQVNFSLWEYGEVAWRPMLLYPSGMMTVTGFLWGVIYAVRDWISPFLSRQLERFWNWLKSFRKNKPSTWRLPEISRQAKSMFAFAWFAFFIFLLILIVTFTLQFVQQWGAFNGQLAVLERATKVELVSAVPMTLSDASVETAQVGQGENQYYVYKGFRLLTINGGKYYLFKEIDPATCKPLQVYVIDADQYKQVHLLAAESLSNQCQKNKKSSQTNIAPTATPAKVP